MFQAAFCARLRGASMDTVRSAWEKRCDTLARLEAVWGAKHWTSGRMDPSPDAGPPRPPVPPRLCFLERDRLWDADYTAQSSHARPPSVMPDDLVNLLDRVI
jgi:hypothetical protein